MKIPICFASLLFIAHFMISCETKQAQPKASLAIENKPTETSWPWADSLDALIAAPENHKLIFENEELRILHVTVIPGILDPIHTHKGKSIVWVTKTSPIIYKTYGVLNNQELTLVKVDTIIIKPEELNKASWENPEPPHSVENIGKDTFELYRIEYKSKIN